MQQIYLRLPACTDAVELRVNGVSCGKRSWPPYVFALTPHMHKGSNVLQIRVSNTLGNVITETYRGKAPQEYPVSGILQTPELLIM